MKYLLAILLAACGQPQKGDTGPAGAPGIPGQDATTISMVQVCPGVTPTYPTTFPEYLECFQGNLFGVYSFNNGFWSTFPPGTYSSNAVGSACDFTIGPNCTILHP